MIGKLKDWLWKRFLPEYCRQSLTEENERLRRQLEHAKQENAELESYIRGMDAVLRSGRRIRIVDSRKEGD